MIFFRPTSLFYWLCFLLFFIFSTRRKLSLVIPWYSFSDFVPLFIIGDTFEVLPDFFMIFLHGYHLFPLLFSHVFDFFYSHDSHFFYVMIHFFVIQGLHYCITLNHLL